MALHLHVSNAVKDGKTTRTTTLSQDAKNIKPIDVFYEFDRELPWTEDSPIDGNVFGVLLYAMSIGQPFHLHGPITQTAIRNMEEFQNIWLRWKPQDYKRIDIIADRIITIHKHTNPEKAVVAFSGGVDALFTTLEHTQRLPEHLRYPVKSALMVHGFDVDIYNYDDFNGLQERVKPFLDEVGIDLRTVRTNSRELRLQNWSDSPSLELAACLYMLGEEFDYGLIGSSYPYDAMILPKGATPLTDSLIRGDHFSTIHDGCGYARIDKIGMLANNKSACEVLKVCYEGADQGQNCGICEKCVRTRMNFWAMGYDGALPCFPDNYTDDMIATLNIPHHGQYDELLRTLEHARANNIEGAWMDKLEARLNEWKPIDPKKLQRDRHGSPTKNAIKKVIVAMGLEEPAKKTWRKFKRNVLKK